MRLRKPETEEARPASDRRVVLAILDPPRADVIARAFFKRRAHVNLAASLEDLVSLSLSVDPDAIVLDVGEADIDLAALVSRLERLRHVPVIVTLSGNSNGGVTNLANCGAVVERLPACVEPEALVDRVLAVSGPPRGTLGLVGNTPVIQMVREQIRATALLRGVPVLLVGAEGTEKRRAALEIHAMSASTAPLTEIDCSAVDPVDLAAKLRAQRTKSSDDRAGTLYLHDFEGLPQEFEGPLLAFAKMPRDRTARAASSTRRRTRLIVSTARRLDVEGLVSRDLWRALAGFVIRLPPLRERVPDIPALALALLEELVTDGGVSEGTFLTDDALFELRAADFLHNLRDLRRILERAAERALAGRIEGADVARVLQADSGSSEGERNEATNGQVEPESAARGLKGSLPEIERAVIVGTYEQCGGNLSATAERLGIPRSTLRDRLRRYRLR